MMDGMREKICREALEKVFVQLKVALADRLSIVPLHVDFRILIMLKLYLYYMTCEM